MKQALFSLFTLLLSMGCTSVPSKVTPVTPFDINQFTGTWYEIARLDHSFESGLSNVTATYELRDDGGINVINRGYSQDNVQWQEALGKAYFVTEPNFGHLKVSFWGPFYSSYVVFGLGENYDYAFVSGYNEDYLWLLSRKPNVNAALLEEFKQIAKEKGFNTDELIVVQHDPISNETSN